MINSNYGTLSGTLSIKQGDEVIYSTENVELKTVKDEWVWVDAYKGTDKDMKCRDMQYEMGTVYEFDGDVKVCEKGYHCCKKLDKVCFYYDIGNGNRFFKVRALVRKEDAERGYSGGDSLFADPDKYVAKKIEFIEEIEDAELFETLNLNRWVKGEKYYKVAREEGLEAAYKDYLCDELVGSYPKEVVDYLRTTCSRYQFEMAVKIANAPHMGLDTKYAIIFSRD